LCGAHNPGLWNGILSGFFSKPGGYVMGNGLWIAMFRERRGYLSGNGLSAIIYRQYFF
jgi:hypothetical protein